MALPNFTYGVAKFSTKPVLSGIHKAIRTTKYVPSIKFRKGSLIQNLPVTKEAVKIATNVVTAKSKVANKSIPQKPGPMMAQSKKKSFDDWELPRRYQGNSMKFTEMYSISVKYDLGGMA